MNGCIFQLTSGNQSLAVTMSESSSALLPITTLMQWVNKPRAWLFQLIFIRNSNCNCNCKRTVWVWDASAAFVLYNSKLFQNRMPNMGTLRRSKVAAFRQQKGKYYQWNHYVGGHLSWVTRIQVWTVDALTDKSAATKFIGRSDTSTTSPTMEATSWK